MYYPTLTRLMPGLVDITIEVDREVNPWPTFVIWDACISSRRSLEWGVMPAGSVNQAVAEGPDGTFGTICFCFEEGTGRFRSVQIPSNLVAASTPAAKEPLPTTNGAPSAVAFFDLTFWSDSRTSRAREKTLLAPAQCYVSANELRIQFCQDLSAWIGLAPGLWIGLDSEERLVGLWCLSSAVDFSAIVRSY